MNKDTFGKPEVIGQGTYGCVHKPQMKCKDRPRKDETTVSKLMTRENANQELGEYSLIDFADEKKEYYLGIPDDCNVDDKNAINLMAIAKCRDFEPKQVENYKLLLMKYGGKDLDEFGKEVKQWSKTPENIKKIELFWIEVSRLFRGLNAFKKNGIVHHDLKHPNVVYNQGTNRINFIDFGFMTDKDSIINKCRDSDYWLAQKHHWSFPIEIVLWNKKTYNRYANGTVSKLAKDFSTVSKEISKQIGYFFDCITDFKSGTAEYKNITSKMIKQFFNLSMNLDKREYNQFINKSIDTVDSYGLGIALMYMLKKSTHLLDRDFSKRAFLLFKNMVHPNVYSRYDTDMLMNEYEEILSEQGLLKKHNMKFDNHRLVDGAEIPTVLEKTIDMIVKDTANVSKSDLKTISVNDEPVRICPPGKVYKPSTKRCVKTCKHGYVPNANFKCVRDKNRKTVKKCPTGKILNPKTNRCKNLCKPGKIHNEKGNCVNLKGNPFSVNL